MNEPEHVMPDGTRYAIVERTDAVEVEMSLPAGVHGPPAHRHPRMEETYVVLEGTLDLLVDGRWQRLRAGQCATVPPGRAHTYRNAGDRPARFKTSHSPAQRFAAYMRELGRLAHSGVLRHEAASVIPLSMVWNRYGDCFYAANPLQRWAMHLLDWLGRVHPRFRHV